MVIALERYMLVIPANEVPGPKQGRWTYKHYATLPDDGQRYEVVEGVLYMTPAPGIFHQKAVVRLTRYLFTHVEEAGLGEVFVSPTDVELSANLVVQPDVVVVLNKGLAKIVPSHIIGAPDLVVEVSSPGTVGYDRRIKQDAYAREGIAEYWLADPLAHTVEVLVLEGGAYQSSGVFSGQEVLLSKVVPTMNEVRVEQFFK